MLKCILSCNSLLWYEVYTYVLVLTDYQLNLFDSTVASIEDAMLEGSANNKYMYICTVRYCLDLVNGANFEGRLFGF